MIILSEGRKNGFDVEIKLYSDAHNGKRAYKKQTRKYKKFSSIIEIVKLCKDAIGALHPFFFFMEIITNRKICLKKGKCT